MRVEIKIKIKLAFSLLAGMGGCQSDPGAAASKHNVAQGREATEGAGGGCKEVGRRWEATGDETRGWKEVGRRMKATEDAEEWKETEKKAGRR